MPHVLGQTDPRGTHGHLGHYRARDGSEGAAVALDLERPHAIVIVGKRGYGKSHTLGVIAELGAAVPGLAPVLVDPMGEFVEMAASGEVAATVHEVAISPSDLDPPEWCALVGLDPADGPGSVLWHAVSEEGDIADIREAIRDADADAAHRRVAANHLAIATEWGIFDAAELELASLTSSAVSVLDLSAWPDPAKCAVVAVIARRLYWARVQGTVTRLPWLLLDECHTFFDGVSSQALRRLLTRGRTPGVSLVIATQRPNAVPAVGLSQSDMLIAHRLTAQPDLEALECARPSYIDGTVRERLPETPGEALIIDDATESAHPVSIRQRRTTHGGASPRVGDIEGVSARTDSSG